ncbi:hypothetical protein VDG1235_2810 [Verrucomicrobiia bacterium DG1235]|nr:hypothetical protein VDG1235_2810 [Verrucomicrobiae bacterium DG1235]
MIIYGTGNFNRRDYSLVRCNCQSCGRRDYQRSYTSTRFFTLYFIPVIPLGSQRVLQECQHCKNAFGLSLGDHKRFLKKEYPQTIKDYQENPADEAAADKLISALIRAQDKSILKKFAPQIAATFPKNGQLLGGLAEACSYLCLDDLADEYYLLAVNADEDEIIANSAERHMKQKGGQKPTPPNRILQSLPVFIVPGVLLFFLGNFLQKAASSTPENVYLVNGLDRAYEVYVNDELVRLPPQSRVTTSAIKYAENTIRPAPGSLPIEQSTFSVDSVGFLSRAFDDSVFVINPDRAALLSWERTVYAVNPVDDFKYKIHTGKLLHSYDKIDYAFADFPEEVSMPSSSSRVYKTRLNFFTGWSSQDIVSTLLNNELEAELQAYLAAALRFEKDDRILIATGSQQLDEEHFFELAQPHLDERPVNVEWHRYTQNAQESDDETKLVDHYRKLYEADPNNNQLAYLYARIEPDPKRSEELMLKAANSSQPSGYANYGLSYFYMMEGDFELALHYSEKSLKWMDASQGPEYTRRISQFGLGLHESIAEECDEKLEFGFNAIALYDYLYAMSKLGESDKAIKRLDDELAAWQATNGASSLNTDEFRRYFDQALMLAHGNRTGYADVARRGSSANEKFQSQVLDGKLETASFTINAAPADFDATDQLLLYILLDKSGNEALASEHREKAVQALSQQSMDEQKWAQWLAGKIQPSVAEAVHTSANFEMMHLLLSAYAHSLGEDGYAYAAHARKLQHRESFYTLALKDPATALLNF